MQLIVHEVPASEIGNTLQRLHDPLGQSYLTLLKLGKRVRGTPRMPYPEKTDLKITRGWIKVET